MFLEDIVYENINLRTINNSVTPHLNQNELKHLIVFNRNELLH